MSSRHRKLWDAAAGTELITLEGSPGVVLCLAFAPGGRRLASGSQDKPTNIWDTVTGKKQFGFGQPSGIRSVAFSPDGRRLASSGLDKIIKIWNISDWTKATK